MPDKRRKTVAWFLGLLESLECSYSAGTHEGMIVVTSRSGRRATFTAYDLEHSSRTALRKRLERLSAGADETRKPYSFPTAGVKDGSG